MLDAEQRSAEASFSQECAWKGNAWLSAQRCSDMRRGPPAAALSLEITAAPAPSAPMSSLVPVVCRRPLLEGFVAPLMPSQPSLGQMQAEKASSSQVRYTRPRAGCLNRQLLIQAPVQCEGTLAGLAVPAKRPPLGCHPLHRPQGPPLMRARRPRTNSGCACCLAFC